MKFNSVKNLIWVNPEHTTFDCVVDFEGIGEVPFACSSADPNNHSIEIWSRATSGEFGPIAEYVEPEQPTITPPSDGIPGTVL